MRPTGSDVELAAKNGGRGCGSGSSSSNSSTVFMQYIESSRTECVQQTAGFLNVMRLLELTARRSFASVHMFQCSFQCSFSRYGRSVVSLMYLQSIWFGTFRFGGGQYFEFTATLFVFARAAHVHIVRC